MYFRIISLIFVIILSILPVLTPPALGGQDQIQNNVDANRPTNTPLIILSWNKYTFDIMKSNPSRGKETPIVIHGKTAGYYYKYYNAVVVWPLATCANLGVKGKPTECIQFIKYLLSNYSPKLIVSLQTGGMHPNSNKTNIGTLFKIVRINYKGECLTIPNQIASALPPAVELYTTAYHSKKQKTCDSHNVMLSSNSLGFPIVMGEKNDGSPKLLVIAGLTDFDRDNPSLSKKEYSDNKWAVALEIVNYVNQHFINIKSALPISEH